MSSIRLSYANGAGGLTFALVRLIAFCYVAREKKEMRASSRPAEIVVTRSR